MRTRNRLLVALLALGLSAAALGLPATASAQEPEGWAYAIANDLMSPYCPGRTLAECPSEQAQTLRMWILTQAAAGRSQDEVMDDLLERFGDEILAAPRPEGFGLAAYVIPVVLFVLGGLLVMVFIRRQTRPAAEDGDAARADDGPLDPELERLVEEDLAR
ncbi:MAG: cytochrome c-type biogenesis protein CcmH [Myxococcota bacterium]|nr:cytochrome c-type biogenesis protein CcmH [Myxococcota bacterium]